MLTTTRILVSSIVSAACVAGRAGIAAVQPPAGPPKVAQVGLRIDDIMARPQVWPDTITLTKPISDGKTETKAGTVLPLYNLERGGVIVEMPKTKELTMVNFGTTDLFEKANAQLESLPEWAKSIKLNDLVERTDLLPPTVRLIEDVTFPDKVRKAGSDIGPYKLFRTGSGFQLMAVDPELVKKGTINARQTYVLEATDYRKQRRALIMSDKRESRLLAEIKGRLVDASGKTVAEPEKPSKFYAIYSGAAWCGWCARFDPELIKFYDEAKAKKMDVEVIYLSQDKSEAEMMEHMKKDGIKYPAVKFDQRLATPFMIGLVSGSTPHLVVVTTEGKIVHNGEPAGMNGAQQALLALRRELAKAPK